MTEPLHSFPKLGESNYSTWSVNIKSHLIQMNLWFIVTGVDTRPSPDDPHLREWLKDMQSASGLILLALEDSQKSQVQDHLVDPKLMWNTLESLHVHKSPDTRSPDTRCNAYNTLLSIQKNHKVADHHTAVHAAAVAATPQVAFFAP